MAPIVPLELQMQIVLTAWHMPLSSKERITIMQSFPLVNSSWADIFDCISSRDVYIPSSACCEDFIRRLRSSPPILVPRKSLMTRLRRHFYPSTKVFFQRRPANDACRSITIQIVNDGMRLPMGGVLDDLLESLDAFSLAPSLRRLSIEYIDTAFDDDIFDRVGLAALPEQVEHLDVRFSFSSAAPGSFPESSTKRQERRRFCKWVAPSVRRLSVIGAGEVTIKELLVCCPNAVIIE
ncbi:hypothetical protein R3P38DRAFT_2638601 [Favolaschia claudopus]|uniref:F-box domain-containing protein n=1 Tax=Favolaschia claudopus TaxID=2862362 RepID=A0AAW0AMS9_9AGAR